MITRREKRIRYKLRHPEQYKAAKQRERKNRRLRFINWITAYKLNHPCSCGEVDPVCLDFHHIDPTQKDLTISKSNWLTISKLILEIKKCVCICANCHRKGHAGRPRPEHAAFFSQPIKT